MSDSSVEQVLVNLTHRSVTILSDEGEVREINWKHDEEGAEGFHETLSGMQDIPELKNRIKITL